jgi:hypothetical protein
MLDTHPHDPARAPGEESQSQSSGNQDVQHGHPWAVTFLLADSGQGVGPRVKRAAELTISAARVPELAAAGSCHEHFVGDSRTTTTSSRTTTATASASRPLLRPVPNAVNISSCALAGGVEAVVHVLKRMQNRQPPNSWLSSAVHNRNAAATTSSVRDASEKT